MKLKRNFYRAFAFGMPFFFLSISYAASSSTVIDDFSESTIHWTFSNAGSLIHTGVTGLATGSVALTPAGFVGQGCAFTYDFTLNVHAANSWAGTYVSANSPTLNIAAATAISFWVKVTPGIHLGMILRDSSGQTLVYRTSRPFQSTDPNAWYQEIIPIDGPDHSTGGAADGIVHFPITQIQIQAVDPSSPSLTSGTMYFDEVTAITSPLQVDLTSNPLATYRPPVQSTYLSDNLGVGGLTWGAPVPTPQELDIAKSASINWVRMDIGWNGRETTKGSYNFGTYDTFVSQLQSRNMKALCILDYGNPIYSGQTGPLGYYYPPVSASDITAFGNFVAAAATRYAGKGVTYEVWNEEDQPYAWPPGPDPVQYSALLDETLTRVHAADAKATVVSGGISFQQDTPFLDYPYLSVMYASSHLKTEAQGIGLHPYRSLVFPETVTADIIQARSIAPNLPFWVTEWGYSSQRNDPTNGHSPAALAWQARMVVRELISQWLIGSPTVFYFSLVDAGTDPTDYTDNLGLVNTDYSDKPAMTAVRTLTTQTNGRTFSGMVPSPDTGVNILRFEGASPLFVVWATLSNSSINVLLPNGATGVDMYGHPLTLTTSGSNKMLLLHESDGPVYLQAPVIHSTIALSLTNLAFTASAGGASPPTQTFTIGDSVPATTFAWSLASNAAWLTATPTSGTASGGAAAQTVTVAINPSGLTAGTYTGKLTITAPGATNTPATVTVVLNVIAPVKVSVTPTSASLRQGASTTFTATVTGTTNTGVTWTRTPALGNISQTTGVYTAPTPIATPQSVTITATSNADSTQSGSASVSLVPPIKVEVGPTNIPLGPNQTQTFTATVTGTSNSNVTWSISPSAGSITSGGIYTAPATVTTPQTVTVKALSAADSTTFGLATISLSNTMNTPPQVSITSPANNSISVAPATIVLTATASDNGSVSQVLFFNGTTLLTTTPLITPPYMFTWSNVPAGTYLVTAQATDNQNAVTTSENVTLIVNPAPSQPPTAVIAGGPFSGTPPLTVPVDGSQSSAPGGTIVSYQWDFGDGSTATGATASHSYTAAGLYAMTLLVTNDQGQVGATAQIINTLGSGSLPTPDLSNLNGGSFPVNGNLSLTYNTTITGFKWFLVPVSSGFSGNLSSRTLGQASVDGYPTLAPQLGLSTLGLSVGAYTLSVQAINGNQTSEPGVANISLVFNSLDNVRVYPNPWRRDKNLPYPITFDQMTSGSDIKIFTVSGHKIKELTSTGSSATWDLTTDSGDRVASGIYIYLIKDNAGNKLKGKVAVIQ